MSLIVVSALGACSSGTADTPAATGGRIAYITGSGSASPYSISVWGGIQEVAAKRGFEAVQFDAQGNPQTQQQQCQDAITAGYKAIVAIPINGTGLVGCAEEAAAAGVAFGTVAFPLGPDPESAAVQVPGQTVAVLEPAPTKVGFLLELLESACAGVDSCRVVVMGGVLADTFDTTLLAELNAWDVAQPTIEILGVREGKYQTAVALSVAADALTAYPAIDVFASISDPMTVGIETAITNAGRTDTIKIVSGGYTQAGLTAVTESRWFGTFLTLPGDEGRIAADIVLRAASGERISGVAESAVARSGATNSFVTRATLDDFANLPPQW